MTISVLLLAFSVSVIAPQEPSGEMPSAEVEGTAPKKTHLPDEVVVVPLDLALGWPVIEVRVNQAGPYRMILDTGSSVTVLHARLQEELGIESTGTTRIGDPSNPTALEFDIIALTEIAIGDAWFEELTAVTWTEDMGLSRHGIDGIVGLPVFQDCLVTLDYPAKEVRIEKGALPEADGKRVVAFEGEHNITLELELGGETVDAHFDSGNSRNIVLPASFEKNVTLVAGTEHRGQSRRASGTHAVHGGKLDGEIRIGGRVLDRPDVIFDASLPLGNVGRTLLEAGPITIDLKNRRLRLAPDAASGPEPRVTRRDLSPGGRRLGIEMRLGAGSELRILRVHPGSLAEKSGLESGDVLLTVDGKAVSAIEHGPLTDALAKPDGFPIEVQRGDETLVIQIPAA